MNVQSLADSITAECEKIIVGKRECIRLIINAVLADGHVLLDDLPGVGKTTLVKTLSTVLGCEMQRVQFVPDMLPGDILGIRFYNQKTCDFELRPGPVMTNLLLADEINRAVPRTQSALLEAMEERQISIDGETLPLPRPFLVLATQNPVEGESTFRLPAAQMDRFLIRVNMGYPDEKSEKEMMLRLGSGIPFDTLRKVTDAAGLLAAGEEIASVHVSGAVADYIVSLVNATRNHSAIKMGASPRGSLALFRAAKVRAAMQGRSFVLPDDVQALAHPVLDHRLVLDSSARFSGTTESSVIDEILRVTPAVAEADIHHEI